MCSPHINHPRYIHSPLAYDLSQLCSCVSTCCTSSHLPSTLTGSGIIRPCRCDGPQSPHIGRVSCSTCLTLTQSVLRSPPSRALVHSTLSLYGALISYSPILLSHALHFLSRAVITNKPKFLLLVKALMIKRLRPSFEPERKKLHTSCHSLQTSPKIVQMF